jgi:hypothetical protein
MPDGDNTTTGPRVLSDQGKGLIRFCETHGIQQFFCHRHLIEKFGSSSPAGMPVARVLRILTRKEFIRLRPQFLAEAQEMFENHLISFKSLVKIRDWLEADPKNFRDGLWHRIKLGIARCSNHAERFHGVVNQRIKAERVYALPRRLRILYDEIVLKSRGYGKPKHRQLIEAFNQLRLLGFRQREHCPDKECAHFCRMMNYRYGITWFPCPHTTWRPMGELPRLPSIINNVDAAKIASFREPKLVRMPRRGKRKVPGFGTAPFKPNPPPEIRKKKKTVLVWDDEKGPDEHIGFASRIPHYHIARGILTGVFYLRKRAKRCPEFDKLAVTFLVLDDLRERYLDAFGNPTGKPPTPEESKWLAQYAIPWWKWARNNKNCPVSARSPGQPPLELEQPIPDDSMPQPISTSDIEEPRSATAVEPIRPVRGPLSLIGMFRAEPEMMNARPLDEIVSSTVAQSETDEEEEEEEAAEEEEDQDDDNDDGVSGNEQARLPGGWFRPPVFPEREATWLKDRRPVQTGPPETPKMPPVVAPPSEPTPESTNTRGTR